MPPFRSEHRLLSSVRAAWLLFCALTLAVLPASAQRFSTPSTISTGDRPGALVSANFTSVGTPELLALDAAATASAATVEVLANNKGTFSLAQVIPTAGSALLSMPARSGLAPDLYWTQVAGNMATLRRASGQSAGNYAGGTTLTTFTLTGKATPKLLLAAGGLHAGYANSVIVADTVNNLLYSLLPNPDGTWALQPVTGTGELPLIPAITQMITTDLNGDGVPDLVAANPNGVQVFLAQTDSSGSFTGFLGSAVYPCTGTVGSIALADMDGDSHVDLLAEGAAGRIDIYHGIANGSFATVSEVGTGVSNAGTGNGGQLVGVADLNGDGIPDLVLSNQQGITVLLGTGSRNFQLNGAYAPGYSPTHFVFTDLNGDGRPDIAFDSPAGVTVIYAINATPTGKLTASPEPSVYGSDFTLTLTLTASPGTAAPTGTVTFSVDGAVVGAGTIVGGAASYTVTSPTYVRGAHTLQAAYSGDSNYLATSFTGTHTVQGLPDSTTITDLVTPIYYGQEIGYTNGIDAVVSVSATSNSPPPAGVTTEGGLIYIYLDAQLVCSLTVGAVGPAGGPQRCNDASFQGYGAGMHTMVGVYQGNSYYEPSTSPTYTVTILPDDTVTTLTTSLNPSPYGAQVTLTAAVTAPYATPAGTVQFFDGTTLLATVPVSPTGASFVAAALYRTSSLAAGTHAITASYVPTPIPGQTPPLDFNPSQSTLSQVIYFLPAITLTSSVNPSVVGQSVTFTADAGSSVTSGSIIFFIDSVPAIVPLAATGSAAYTTSSLAVGSHNVSAFYSPSSSTPVGTAVSLTQVVTAVVASGFTLSITPATLAIGVGNNGDAMVTVAETGSFSEPVALTCSALPYAATCAFDSPTMAAGGGSTQLVIHPEAPHACGSTSQYFIAGTSGRTTFGLAALTALLLGWRKRRLRLLLAAALLCLFPTFLTLGCGGNCTDLGTRPGTYTFTVTATSTATHAVQSQTVTFHAYLDGEPH